jgi:predicted MPP superfamily phosphohydrolase
MEKRLWIRDFAVLIPLIAAQMGIYLALRPWRRWVANLYGSLAIAALGINGLSILWLFGAEFHGAFGHFLSVADGVGETALFTTTATYLMYLVCRWIGRAVPEEVSQERRRLLEAAGALAVASPVMAMAYGILVGRTEFGVREVTLPIPGLHPDLEGLRILHLSDIHRGQFLSARDLERVIDMTNGLRPHLSVMTGDLISREDDPMEECVRQLARVKADAGMFGCLGNHEMYARVESAVKSEAARRGIPFLRLENRQLRFGGAVLNIGGVDYQRSSSRKDYLKGAEKLLVPGALNLMLSHNPDTFPKAAGQGWDLTLAGHTHGGQVTVEIVEQSVNVARFFTPYVAGEYHLGNASCYVTRGIGTVGVPARLGVPPEITLMRVRKA